MKPIIVTLVATFGLATPSSAFPIDNSMESDSPVKMSNSDVSSVVPSKTAQPHHVSPPRASYRATPLCAVFGWRPMSGQPHVSGEQSTGSKLAGTRSQPPSNLDTVGVKFCKMEKKYLVLDMEDEEGSLNLEAVTVPSRLDNGQISTDKKGKRRWRPGGGKGCWTFLDKLDCIRSGRQDCAHRCPGFEDIFTGIHGGHQEDNED